ncbi:type I restriction-modification system endonuclease [Lelliottia aquatilis]|uniref:type I restriction-modification system endonuclease n=1 Tax=Lelliottia aquatilis TaxID=2080838 RepID=UPI000CDEDCB3|nr:type I restriction-modification system endonuclease [Lelliottia aquatilis]POZ16498.1 type I restriction-modification system endonuclease [Lelliottia aquatilis]
MTYASLHTPTNFDFLAEHDPLFVKITTTAEQLFSSDPNTTLMKLRQFGEALAQNIAVRLNISQDDHPTQQELLYRLDRELQLDPAIRQLFHTLRIEGNKATHRFQTKHREALDALRIARALAIWFHQTFSKTGSQFDPGPFLPPHDPSEQLSKSQSAIELLKQTLLAANQKLESSEQLQTLLKQQKEEYEQLAQEMDLEAREQQELLEISQQDLQILQHNYETKLKELQKQLTQQSQQAINNQRKEFGRKSTHARKHIITEELTRILIDQQLNEWGWLADSQELTYKKGSRPEKGVNKAIAEWPTFANDEHGRADYILFCGLVPVATVEAKKKNENVAGKIPQAERYSRGFQFDASLTPAWAEEGRMSGWEDGLGNVFQIPFAFSCNGRAYIKQSAEFSGTWFRDMRSPENTRYPLESFITPEGLMDRLHRSRAEAEAKLHHEPFGYLGLRDYQVKAVQAVESVLEKGSREALLAMATGTGKTRTIIGLIYRFLKVERFKRILFLVDRSALGEQAEDAFKEASLEQNQTLSQIYNIAELGDMAPEAETRVQVATVQAMVSRIYRSGNPPAVDTYDCIIIDEAHRGYTLDQEMTEGELSIRDNAQYLSSYRRVLDYFDAVKIGLTATPAKHTSEIFGHPVYIYSYREAVAEDWLIDHEPPVRYETQLSRYGIHFERGDKVSAIDAATGEVDTSELEDELNFDVEAFNRKVITEDFNRVICEELAKEIDPAGDEKTLIFCATDAHADMVKRLLDKAMGDLNPDFNQAAIEKITGKSDQVSKLIKRYKNERYPSIAITVDLLTTGIDVPAITHLVFLRRVKSRILYEQMIGRATRRCDDIGKTIFWIHDPVDIYATLQDVNTMKPLVKNSGVSIEQLVEELSNDEVLETALNHPGDNPTETQADSLLAQLSQKVMRVLRKAENKAEKRPDVRQKLNELEELWGVEPKKLHQHLHELGPQQASAFLKQHRNLIRQLSDVGALLGSEYRPVISNHEDRLIGKEQTYGRYQKPADYLQSFDEFISTQLNKSAALSVVINRPRDLTREQLKEIRLLLDAAGYSEASLRSAVRTQSNQDIAATIIGHIRRAALGEPLIPFEERVKQALEKIYTRHNWSTVQKRWLERLAKQLVHEVVLDKNFVNHIFSDTGGVKILNGLLDNQLDSILEEMSDALWASKSA